MNIRYLAFLSMIVIAVIACSSGQTATGGALQIKTTALPAWEAPGSATYKLIIAGGTPPYSFSITSGQLPQGFNLGSDGTIGGLARLDPGTTKSESPSFTVTVKDSAGHSADASYTIKIVETNTLQIITTPATCTVKQKCDVQIATASGGNPPYGFQSDTFMNGAPPLGTIVGTNGHLTGTPNKEGEYTVGVCATDSQAYQKCGTADITVQKGTTEETWAGPYTEVETSPNCVADDAGTLTFTFNESHGDFSGTVFDNGSSTSSDPDCADEAYASDGTISGSITGDTLTGTMYFTDQEMSYVIPFTATIADDVMTGNYAGTITVNGGSFASITGGSFTLNKQS